jgi:hypothetical protein
VRVRAVHRYLEFIRHRSYPSSTSTPCALSLATLTAVQDSIGPQLI